MASGFVKIPHDVIDRFGDDPEKLGAFVWLLRSRDFKTGVLESSVRNLAAQFGWSHGKAQRLHTEVTACSVGLIDDKWYKSGTPSGTPDEKKRYTSNGANQQESLVIQDGEAGQVVHLIPKSGTPSGRNVVHPPPQTRENIGSAAPLDVDVVDNYSTTTTTPLVPPGGSDEESPTEAPLKPKAKSKKKPTPPPAFADFEITEGMRLWFRKQGWTATEAEVLGQTEQMLDDHRGKGNLKADWVATWRTWMRNWQTNFGRGGSPSRPTNGASPQYQQRTGPQPHKFHPDDPLLKESPNVIG